MQLSMTVLRCPDQVAPEARSVSGGEFHVGRGPDVDWVLPDPDRLLSKRHFAVAFRGGAWQIADTSTNGTFMNGEADAIGRGATRSLRDGDRLRLGAYELEIRLVEQPMAGQSLGAGGGFGGGPGIGGGMGGGMGGMGGQQASSPFGDPFADDPLAPPPPARTPFGEPAYSDLGMAHSSAQLPHDFDPLAPDRDEPFGGGFRGPVQSDHSSAMQDAMMPPPITGYAAAGSGGIIPGDDLLPDDWDKDLLEGIAPPSPVAPAAFEAPAAEPPWRSASAAPTPAAVPPLDFTDPLAPATGGEAAWAAPAAAPHQEAAWTAPTARAQEEAPWSAPEAAPPAVPAAFAPS